MELRFTAAKKEILKTMKIVKTGLPKGGRKKEINIELQIGMNKVVMEIPGVSFEFYGKTVGLGKAFLPFLQFESMVKDSGVEEITVIVEAGKARVGKFTASNPAITISHVENIISIDLPVNYTLIDLIALKHRYSLEDLMANNFIKLIEDAEEKREANVHKALQLLKPFGITYEDLNFVIEKKIHEAKFK